MERVKSVMQIHEIDHGKCKYRWSGECLAELYRKEGISRGIFRGWSGLLLREIPQFAVYYPCFDFFKKNLSAVMIPDI
jgi:hypothetical protein